MADKQADIKQLVKSAFHFLCISSLFALCVAASFWTGNTALRGGLSASLEDKPGGFYVTVALLSFVCLASFLAGIISLIRALIKIIIEKD